MANRCRGNWLLSVAILVVGLSMSLPCLQSLRIGNKAKTKSAVFVSPKFELAPGSVLNKYYFGIDFPKGHIALKSFDAEVVDEAGNSVPLHETYLHHWVLMRYHVRTGVANLDHYASQTLNQSDFKFVRNSGMCQGNTAGQYFGLGSETRRTSTYVPDPYGIEIGNPAEIPDGFKEGWMLNVHAIDTRGAVDGLGCTECRCDLYNITKDEYGRPLRPDYLGGLLCCYDQTQCRVKHGFPGSNRILYLRYTVQWLEWSDSILPVNIYIFDVTDTLTPLDDRDKSSDKHECLIEYEVAKSCKSTTGDTSESCIDTKRNKIRIPSGGYVVYGVAHQHTGGIGSTLYGQDGRVICSSIPRYGKGNEAGNEAGYIVGMSTCYPKAGIVKIADGETLRLESNYSSSRVHTGVMGLFYILIADQLPNAKHSLV